ncbi:MAG: SPOR domain-containing protein [Bdellovibrionota bacterium]|nr:SPOR domain-containing protein [Bdellovibrionota bacterium]
MEDQNKLFVFERKEVVLIFIFIILIAVISFTLGVRTGKSLSLKTDGYTKKDVEMIELKSETEEKVEDVAPMEAQGGESGSPIDQQTIEQRIKDEMKKLAEEDVSASNTNSPAEPVMDESSVNDTVEVNNPYAGKFTVQLASHKTQESAQEFADAFIIKGYDVIINEANIPGKGKWYRVSLGLFDTRQEALNYISKEKSLFQDREYTINQL